MYILTNFLLFCAINAFTPGPGNLLVMNVAAARGFKDGRPLFCGVFAGYFAVQSLSAVLTLLLSSRLPSMLGVMKYLGAVYIVWLAVRLVRSRPQAGADGREASFIRGFLLQLLNVKIYMFGLTAQTGYVLALSEHWYGLFAGAYVIAGFGVLAALCWIWLGVALRRIYLRHYRLINMFMALALLECLYSILEG